MEADESIESVHEANLLSKLDNPYILKYYDSFLDGDYFCIVTEYCEVSLITLLNGAKACSATRPSWFRFNKGR